MSQLNTPTRPKASSGRSTLSNSGSISPSQFLTPRTKVKAMLAALDSDWDLDSFSRDKVSNIEARSLSMADHLLQNVSTRDRRGDSEQDESEGDESEDLPIMPRGKLAARLHSHSAAQPKDIINSDEAFNGNSYDRVKKRLLKAPAKQSTENDDSANIEETLYSKSFGQVVEPRSCLNSSKSTPRSIHSSNRLPRRLSLTSMVTATAQAEDGIKESSPDLPTDPLISTKLQLLVARKREILQVKKKADMRRKAEKNGHSRKGLEAEAESAQLRSSMISDTESEDQADERSLTHHGKLTRKASKKAVEEMNRVTQRMSRNMLGHKAKTKKKIEKESFFTRFNFRMPATNVKDAAQALSSSTVVSSAHVSDMESVPGKESPPTSPERPQDMHAKPLLSSDLFHGEPTTVTVEGICDILPSSLYVLDQSSSKLYEEQQKPSETADNHLDHASKSETSAELCNRQMKIRLSKLSCRSITSTLDSDSDLEILPSKKPRRPKLSIFERLPTISVNEERPLQMLRALAHLNSPGKRGLESKLSISMSDMQTSLQRRARRQAAEDRAEKIQNLQNRGVILQTVEERERDQAEVEDIVDKARREATEIMHKERQAAKKEKLGNGGLNDTELTSDEEDDDYQGNAADESDMDLSGTDEEEAHDYEHINEPEPESEGEGSDVGVSSKAAVDVESLEAGQDKEPEEFITEREVDPIDDGSLIPRRRRRRTTRMIVDDDDMDDSNSGKLQEDQDLEAHSESKLQPFIPGLPFSSVLPMGMTQAFAATMAETQTDSQMNESVEPDHEQDSLTFLGPMPEPDFPMYNLEDSQKLVPDSQNGSMDDIGLGTNQEKAPEIFIRYSQTPMRYSTFADTEDVLAATQYSEIPDPTQDVGFGITSPIKNRFVPVPPSTVDTMLLSGIARNDAPIVKRKGRLCQRTETCDTSLSLSDNDVTSLISKSGVETSGNTFNKMKEAARRPVVKKDAFNHDKSEAKGMVEEQAQESDDEYAGLGGASDDESAAEDDEDVQKMIDEDEVNVDERLLAAFHADKERASDEKAVEKIFKDINNGILRRKRGADFDLSDPDDDVESRQRARRREFARMRKALLENENVGKIAEDPKKLAFLRAIEDRDEDSMGFLEQPEDSSPMVLDTPGERDSQSQNQPSTIPASPKHCHPLQESISDKANRLPPIIRHPRSSKKPSTLAEIRESVSYLIKEPDVLPLHTQPIFSSPQGSDTECTPPQQYRRTTRIVDRISLKRAESTTAASAASSRMAFHDPISSAPGGFRIPSLLRRATTSQLSGAADKNGISISTAGTERAAGGGQTSEFVRRGGGKRSGIAYFARERERHAGAEEAEKRRAEGLRKLSAGVSGLRGLGGMFE